MVKQTFKIIGISIIGFGIVALIALALRVHSLGSPGELKTKAITVAQVSLTVVIADTRILQSKGLSGRESLLSGYGMLFVFDDKKERTFWMKDMLFPLDVLWIADDVVVGMQENIPHELNDGEVVRFISNKTVDMVLEINSGWIEKNNIVIGARVFSSQ